MMNCPLGANLTTVSNMSRSPSWYIGPWSEVGSKFYAGREEAFALLALTLSVQLLPPLGKEAEGRLVAGQ